jgi:hypothetical protein
MAKVGTILCDEVLRALKARVDAESSNAPPFIFNLSDEERDALAKVAQRHAQRANRLERLWAGTSKGKFEYARDKFLSDFHTRVCATIRTFAKRNTPATLNEIYAFAKGIDVWLPLSEIVFVWLKPKDNGGFRPITLDGPRRMAQRFVVRDFLTAIGIDSDCDYTRRGAGGEKALIKDISRRIVEGYGYWQTADIKECFASLRPGHFAWLPLPEPLLRHVVFLPECAKIALTPSSLEKLRMGLGMGGSTETSIASQAIQELIEGVRRGLPLGAVLSPLIARALVGRELRASLGTEKVVRASYVDDLAIGACSSTTAKAAFKKLEKRLRSLPAGPIYLHGSKLADARKEPVRVLGYKLTKGDGYKGNPVHVRPGHKRFAKFHWKVLQAWIKAGRPDLEPFAEPFVDRWMPTQPAWTRVPRLSRNAALSGLVSYLGDYSYYEHQRIKHSNQEYVPNTQGLMADFKLYFEKLQLHWKLN